MSRFLLPLLQHPYPCCRTVPVRATRLGIVTFERNRYSVPSRSAGERLLLRAYPWKIEITDGKTVVARHPRLYGKDGEPPGTLWVPLAREISADRCPPGSPDHPCPCAPVFGLQLPIAP